MTGVLLAVLAAAHAIHAYELGNHGYMAGMVLHVINAAVLTVAALILSIGEGV